MNRSVAGEIHISGNKEKVDESDAPAYSNHLFFSNLLALYIGVFFSFLIVFLKCHIIATVAAIRIALSYFDAKKQFLIIPYQNSAPVEKHLR